ncbi:MAG: hypothetical protein JWM72_3002 [Actinomycetia bacterium]|jgi:hypothetical protein|nr:hypothetical protein [Actinomycetes bacterium]MDQ1461360.1 hypothetical protein [Actinomycetota bacterium]
MTGARPGIPHSGSPDDNEVIVVILSVRAQTR